MKLRLAAAALCVAVLTGPAAAQSSQEVGQMRLYIQQLEEQVRSLTGEVERLRHELDVARAGNPGAGGPSAPGRTGALAPAGGPQMAAGGQYGAPPRDLGTVGIAQDDPLIAPDGATVDPAQQGGGSYGAEPYGSGAYGQGGYGAGGYGQAAPAAGPGAGGPIDLSTLASGAPVPGADFGRYSDQQAGPQPGYGGAGDQTAMAGSPPPTVALSGSARDEYDLAYGYVLTGDYDLAEKSFRSWLAAFPQDQQATDAKFWLGESIYQQGNYREAANTFLDIYKSAPQSPKGPDALVRLGMSLSALGEKDAACATLAETAKRYPDASSALKARADEEMRRAGC